MGDVGPNRLSVDIYKLSKYFQKKKFRSSGPTNQPTKTKSHHLLLRIRNRRPALLFNKSEINLCQLLGYFMNYIYTYISTIYGERKPKKYLRLNNNDFIGKWITLILCNSMAFHWTGTIVILHLYFIWHPSGLLHS